MKRQAKSYSIVDHELLHGGYLSRLTREALALYLFLAVVGDSAGRSFYSVSSIEKILRMGTIEITDARNELINERLIAHNHPYWRVLTLTYARGSGHNGETDHMSRLVKQVLKKSEVMKNDRPGETS